MELSGEFPIKLLCEKIGVVSFYDCVAVGNLWVGCTRLIYDEGFLVVLRQRLIVSVIDVRQHSGKLVQLLL